MKRIVPFLLCLVMLFSALSCSSSLAVEETKTAEDVQKTAEEKKTEEKKKDPYAITDDPIPLPKGYTVGAARADVTPEYYPINISSGMNAERALDPLYFTCVAFSDGENVALVIATDLKGISGDFYAKCVEAIEESTGVPSENVIINATHNHNAPAANSSAVNNIKWQGICLRRMRWVCREAMMDLAPAKASIGKADTTGFAFVRRYLCEDGSLQGIHHAVTTGSPAVKHETEADPDLQLIYFEREGDKKDIAMVNWQCHVAHAANAVKDAVTADLVCNFRKGVEKNHENLLFAYYNGASGNLNLGTKFPEKKAVNGDYSAVGTALVGKFDEAMKALTPVELGPVRAVASTVTGVVRKSDNEEKLEQASLINAASGSEQKRLITEYGFQSKYEASYLLARQTGPKTKNIPVSAITCGDIAFAANACEMFDTNGMEVKAGSPFKMTFMCAYSNGQQGYMPSAFAFDHGGYEVDTTWFEKGTAENLVAELLRLLNELKG